jgi:undecaprenyl-diphosphatase
MRMPLLDEPLRLVSDFANFSKPWLLISGFLACSEEVGACAPR